MPDEPAKPKKGRPRIVIDREAANLIAGSLQLMEPIGVACTAAGISERTFHRWQSAGKAAERKEKKGEKLSEDEKAFLSFWQTVKKSHAVGRVSMVQRISEIARDDKNPKSFYAAAWLLERKYPQEFGRKYVKIEASGPNDGPIQVDAPAPKLNIILQGGAGEAAPPPIKEAEPDEESA